ncbi:MAG: SUMF1/EgtB/PvdO family nonheme iron enzyme [Planctomycetota bacterium]
MPRCLQCNESYADSLRRCPHCGAAPQEEAPAPLPGMGAPRRVETEEASWKSRIPPKRLALVAVLVSMLGLGITFALPGSNDDDIGTTSNKPARKKSARKAQPREAGGGIKPAPLTDSVMVDEPMMLDDVVLVRGTIAANAVVRVLIDGKPVPISADGTRFQAIYPRTQTSFELQVEDVEGRPLDKPIALLANPPEEAITETWELHRPLDGQTFREAKLTVEFAPGSPAPRREIALQHVETLEILGGRVLRLYRAPKGLTFLRVSETGHYCFLRERDQQEMVLVPAGISRRGMGEKPPHGPMHIVRMRAFLVDRTEVTALQYARFLGYMDRAEDPSLRHRDDDGSDLKPAGWDSIVPPKGWEHRPVVGVSWYGAYAYARWVGGRLPSEAQWERAAAGPQGWRYPWGKEFAESRVVHDALHPAAARSHPEGASLFGLLHMAGNASEWCADRFDPRWYRFSPRVDPHGPAGHRHRLVRGGSYASEADALVNQHRTHASPDKKPRDTGFRVVLPWPKEIR